jgi:putative hydrolase of the HAD superfamily
MQVRDAEAFRVMPSCVLLDLDNTFYAYEPCNAAGMRTVEALAKAKLNLGERDFARCFADARTEVKNRLGPTAASHSRLLYFQRTLELAGYASQPVVSLQMEQAYWRAFLNEAVVFDEAAQFLDDLRIAGVPTVIVTDLTAQIQMRKMIHLGLDRLVDWIVTSEETGADKPSASNFELALAKLGGVEGVVWMIGEDPKSDIAGARAAVDAVCLQKRHAGLKVTDSGPGAPHAVFEHFRDLRKHFATLSSRQA